eukprot:645827-Amphidinium_carterae.2
MQIEPDNEVLIAERGRLMRQAWRLWNLHSSGAIPPLNDQVAFEVTLVLGLETPGITDAPVFPYVNRQSRKGSIHSHTDEELRNNAKAAEARHRRRHIAPLGHTLARAAAAAVRRRRVLPPKGRKRRHARRSSSRSTKHWPLPEDPIEEFSPIETLGMASTAQFPPAPANAVPNVPLAGAPIGHAVDHSEAGTLVDAPSSSPFSASSRTCNRLTSEWPEMGEEETPSSSNTTVSASATIGYGPQPVTPTLECNVSLPAAGVAGQPPSMSCVVPFEQRDRAIVVHSQSDDDDDDDDDDGDDDDDDEQPLTHLVNGVDHLSPLLLATLLLSLQVPVTWIAWLPVTVVASPLLLTRSAYKQLRQRKTHWRIGVSVFASAPKTRPTHRFACINPGPARQSSLSFQPTLRDTALLQPTPSAVIPSTAEAAEANGTSPSSSKIEQPDNFDLPPADSLALNSSDTLDATPGWDAPRGMN